MTLPARRNDSSPSVGSVMDPFAELDRFHRQLTEFLDRSWRPWNDTTFVPPADIEETDDSFVVEVELPGVKREDVDVELLGRRLTVHGERKERERVGVLRRRTRRVGEFHYEVVLPSDVADAEVDAKFADGVLTVTIPKPERERARKIKVN
ncbi:MAG: Hsp20/alpha crystallin family protein [Acidimicrobiia bacterium]